MFYSVYMYSVGIIIVYAGIWGTMTGTWKKNPVKYATFWALSTSQIVMLHLSCKIQIKTTILWPLKFIEDYNTEDKLTCFSCREGVMTKTQLFPEKYLTCSNTWNMSVFFPVRRTPWLLRKLFCFSPQTCSA